MAYSTVELRNLLKTSNFELFDFDYQFDDTQMKADIEQSIIDHYFFSEIGSETPDRFKQRFKAKYKRIIGYYNELHNTTLIEYNPIINYKVTEALERLANTDTNHSEQVNTTGEHTGTQSVVDSAQTDRTQSQTEQVDTTTSSTGTTSNTADESEDGVQNQSDYPQNTNTGDYRSGATDNTTTRQRVEDGSTTQSGTGESTSSTSGESTEGTDRTTTTNGGGDNKQDQNRTGTQDSAHTETYEKAIEGLTGRSYQELIQLERESIIRIKSMIIEELKPCFMMTF